MCRVLVTGCYKLPGSPLPSWTYYTCWARLIGSKTKGFGQVKLKDMSRLAVVSGLVVGLVLAVAGNVQALELRTGYPLRYTIVKGDTLWGIAGRYLNDPWRWPVLWQLNEQISNPHRIYPGDVLVMVGTSKQPQLKLLPRQTLKLSPKIHAEFRRNPIPTIPPSAIEAFLSRPQVVEKYALDKLGYVIGGIDKHLIIGKMDRFYARGLTDAKQKYYQVFRNGDVLTHPKTGEVLGYEARFLGTAKLLRFGDPAKLVLTSAAQEIGSGDRLMPVEQEIALPYYQPKAPKQQVKGYLLRILGGVREAGPYQVVILSLGRREGMQAGDVLQIQYQQGQARDPVTDRMFALPDEPSGLLMVFRTFEKVSYGLIVEAVRSIRLGDVVVTP